MCEVVFAVEYQPIGTDRRKGMEFVALVLGRCMVAYRSSKESSL